MTKYWWKKLPKNFIPTCI